MSPWACLLVPASQASIHVESAQSIKQLADSSALSLCFFLPHPLSTSAYFSLSASLFLHLYGMCLSPSHKQAEAQVYFASTPLLASPSPDIFDLT